MGTGAEGRGIAYGLFVQAEKAQLICFNGIQMLQMFHGLLLCAQTLSVTGLSAEVSHCVAPVLCASVHTTSRAPSMISEEGQ